MRVGGTGWIATGRSAHPARLARRRRTAGNIISFSAVSPAGPATWSAPISHRGTEPSQSSSHSSSLWIEMCDPDRTNGPRGRQGRPRSAGRRWCRMTWLSQPPGIHASPGAATLIETSRPGSPSVWPTARDEVVLGDEPSDTAGIALDAVSGVECGRRRRVVRG